MSCFKLAVGIVATPQGIVIRFLAGERDSSLHTSPDQLEGCEVVDRINPYRTAFPYGNGMVLHFYQQQESSTTKTVHKVFNKGLKTYV